MRLTHIVSLVLSRSGSLALVTAALALASGCGDAGASTGGSGGSGGGNTNTNPGTGGSAPAPGADLDGTWSTPCWQKTTTALSYDALSFTGTFTEFADDACTSPIHVSKWAGTAAVTGQTAAGDTKIDLAFTSFKSTALTADNAAFNNMNKYCGATDWEANVEKDVLGKDCYGFSIPVGGKSLDIYRVDATTLKFGQGAKIGTMLGEGDRPTAIDEMRAFMKQ